MADARYNRGSTNTLIIGPVDRSVINNAYWDVQYSIYYGNCVTKYKWAIPGNSATQSTGCYVMNQVCSTGDFNKLVHYFRVFRYPLSGGGVMNPGYLGAWGPLELTYETEYGDLNGVKVAYDPIEPVGSDARTQGKWVDFVPEIPKSYGWHFLGWQVKGEEKVYAPKEIVPVTQFKFKYPNVANPWSTPADATTTWLGNGDLTLVALWRDGKHKMTVTPDLILDVIEETQLPTITGDFNKVGYTFDGMTYNGKPVYDKDLNLVYVSDAYGEGMCDFETDVTLTLEYKPITYIVHFDLNKGTGSIPDIVVTYDSYVDISGVQPTRAGYTLRGWAVMGLTFTTTMDVNLTFVQDEVITLTAIWEANTYQVYYKVRSTDGDILPISRNSDTGVEYSEPIIYDKTFTPTNIPHRYGYVFKYWEVSGTPDQITVPITWNYTEDKTLTPVFEVAKGVKVFTPEIKRGLVFTKVGNAWKRVDLFTKKEKEWTRNELL